MKKKKSASHYTLSGISIITAFLFIIPIIWMLFVSVKPEGIGVSNVIGWFTPPYTFENYSHVLIDTPVLRWLWNSLIVALITTALTLFVTTLAAFAISKMQFRYKTFIYVFFLAGLMVPGEATIIPLYQIVKDMDLLDTYTGLIIPGIASPLGVIILKSFFDGVPQELIESAKMDGCSLVRIYLNIVLPLAKPALAAIGIFTFIGSWNNFLWPFLAIMSEELFTLPVGIPQFNSVYSVDYVLPMTVNAVASIPVIIAFLIFEKQIVRGISFTGIK
ncbi:carbohydrate ABC transporter permease [Lederbergia wuyishanensis]|uniref:Multiple sugar transport system permease protein n=1 Tax=Lederbergia wuyishanensis TaxID=1347903 RepID=A0ABU0D9G8_9BACI|nr:carbohydrate ABC transporter permease [Lederbergia wuyishanensis]MCJ8007494.1 carbohydrate ABC transporter permease [Lederbergia wuyishanensis]MDQ0345067.1 multiple sugar transport system permease protein [Lederbergia wuyishanensis]